MTDAISTNSEQQHSVMEAALQCLEKDNSLQEIAVKTFNKKVSHAKGKLLGLSLPWELADALNIGNSTATEIITEWYKLYIYSFIVDDSFDDTGVMKKEEFFASSLLLSSGLTGLKKQIGDDKYQDLFDSAVTSSLLSEWHDIECPDKVTEQTMAGKNSPILLPLYSMAANSSHANKDQLITAVQESLYFFQILDDIADLKEDISNNTSNFIKQKYISAADETNLLEFKNEDEIWEFLLHNNIHECIFQDLIKGFSKIKTRLETSGFKSLAKIFEELIDSCATVQLQLNNLNGGNKIPNLAALIKSHINAMIASS